DVDRTYGPVAEQCRGDGQHPRPAPDVEHARRRELRPKLDEKLEAEPRRGMAAGPERARRLDDDGNRVLRWCLPGRSDPERAYTHGSVELPPALLPTGRDVGLDRAAEEGSNLGRSGRIGVRGELHSAVSIALLEALGKELHEGGARHLGLGGRDLDRDPPELAQRKMLLSLSKKPSSSR